MKKYFDENPIAELRYALADLREADRKPFYIAIAVLLVVALGLGAVIFFILKDKEDCDDEFLDDCDWDEYDELDDDDCCCCCDCECEEDTEEDSVY